MKIYENRLTVIGLGISGRAAVKLAVSKGFDVVGIDEKSTPELDSFAAEMKNTDNVTLMTGFNGDTLPPSDLVVVSPGVSDSSRLGKLTADSGASVTGELDFASGFIDVP